MRQYGLSSLGESGETATVRTRHRDYYSDMATFLDAPARTDYQQRLGQADQDVDNFRSAFGWSVEIGEIGRALALAISLQPVWMTRGRAREGLAWLEAGLAGDLSKVSPTVVAGALADKSMLQSGIGSLAGPDEAEQALSIARAVDDPALLIRALVARGVITAYDAEMAQPYFAEAAGLARTLGDSWRLSQILGFQARAAMTAGDAIAAAEVAELGLETADAIDDRAGSVSCRTALGWARGWQGDPTGSLTTIRQAIATSTAAHDTHWRLINLIVEGTTCAYVGDADGAQSSAEAALATSAQLVGANQGLGYALLGVACQASGDATAAWDAYANARRLIGLDPQTAGVYPSAALAPLACGELSEARRWADEVVSISHGCFLSAALTTRARVALAQGDLAQAERDAHDALSQSADGKTVLGVHDTLECLAALAAATGAHREAARLFGASEAVRRHTCEVRFKILDADYEAAVRRVRDAMGDKEFTAAWAEGAALSTEQAIAHARRRRSTPKRALSGWGSLTPAELDVVRLVREGLSNKDIGVRIFISPRTVQTHLTHVYAKLGLTSRLQLIQEAALHDPG
jgi:DNA-binding CsgD family transcriptional regulator